MSDHLRTCFISKMLSIDIAILLVDDIFTKHLTNICVKIEIEFFSYT